MKKISALLIMCFCVLLVLTAKSQPQLVTSTDFENGIPSTWTATTGVTIDSSNVVISGTKAVKLKPSSMVSASVSLKTAPITVDANKGVRLEFNHIPMLPSKQYGRIVIYANGQSIGTLSLTSGYDTYKPNGMPTFTGPISANSYWKGLNVYTNVNYSMWRHESFTLKNVLNGNTTFQVVFEIPKGGNIASYGWLIDDVKIYQAENTSADVLLPRVTSINNTPDMDNYPYCGDAEINLSMTSTVGLSTIVDSMYLQYYTDGDTTLKKVNFALDANGNYSVSIPYAGVDSNVYWLCTINDIYGNRTTYPFTGIFRKTKFVRPYVGSDSIHEGGLSSQELFFATSKAESMQQIRYSAKEMKAAGYTAGKIDGMYIKINSVPSPAPVLPKFKVYILQIDTNTVVATDAQYGTDLATRYKVVDTQQYVVPPVGWQFIQFSDDIEFIWDGESDILLSISFDDRPSTSAATMVASYSVTADQYKTRKYDRTVADPSQTAENAMFNTADGVVNYKPNIRFHFVDICHFNVDAGVRTDTIAAPTNAIDCNDTLPTTVVCRYNIPETLRILLMNYGLDTLKNVWVKWMIDDNTSTLDSNFWTGIIPGLDTNMMPYDTIVPFTLTTNFLPQEGVHTLKVWTEVPDSEGVDWNYANDTVIFKLLVTNGPMSGLYAVGGTVGSVPATRTYATLDDAFLMLINSGVNGNTYLGMHSDNIATGTVTPTIYYGSWKFPTCIEGLSANSTITLAGFGFGGVVFMEDGSNPYIFDLSNNQYIKFQNLGFSIQETDTAFNYLHGGFDMIRLNQNSKYITIDSCRFINYNHTNKYYDMIDNILEIPASNNITITRNTFDAPATNQIWAVGYSNTSKLDSLTITKNTFNLVTDSKSNLTNAAINLQYAKNVIVEQNEFVTSQDASAYDKITTNKYAILLSNTDSIKINRNRAMLYCMSAYSLTSANHSVISNNLISIKYDNTSSANYSCYGINIPSGINNKIVYNNIYGNSYSSGASKRVYGLGLGYQGQTITNTILKNNIIVSDGYGYAASVRPSDTNSFNISNNIYYKTASIDAPLFSYNGATSTDTASWITNTKDTLSYYNQNPIFLSWDNLSTANVLLCEAGAPINGITDDYDGKTRPDSTEKNPCIGAREFNPPPSNIYVMAVGLTSGTSNGGMVYTDCDFGTESVFIDFKNISTDTIPTNTLFLNYSVNGVAQTPEVFPHPVYPDTTYHVILSHQYNFTSVGSAQTFEIKGYSILSLDSVKNNDTASALVISLYQLPAIADQHDSVNYGTSDTIDVSSLVPNDSVYWFYNMNDTIPFAKGQQLITGNMYVDSTIYMSRKEEIPVLKISEIQYSKASNKDGQTVNIPAFDETDNAYEISNFGNGAINLTGYKFVLYKASGNTPINKTSSTYTFPDNYILPANTSILLLAAASTDVDSSLALAIGTGFKVTASTKAAYSLNDASNTVIDLVAVNGAKFNASMNIPNTVWDNSTTDTVKMSSTKAGIYRNTVNATSPSGWTTSDINHVMTVGTYNENLTVSTDNGCYGDFTPYHIHIINIPNFDPGIFNAYFAGLNSYQGCSMGSEQLTITLTNTGLQSLDTIPIKCEVYENDSLIQEFTEQYTQLLATGDTVQIVLATSIDFTANNTQRNITVKVYTNDPQDVIHTNDTIILYITSLQTPLPPTIPTVSANYGESATLTANNTDANTVVIWYENADDENILHIGNTYTTDLLYENDTLYAASALRPFYEVAIGDDSSVVSSKYPSPFNTESKYVKEQYLIRASELQAAGYTEGIISNISFKISKITAPLGMDSVSYDDYNIKMGETSSNSMNAWATDLTQVYSSDTLAFHKNFMGWVTLPFDTPYYWDGESNLLIEVCFGVSTKSKVLTYNTTTNYTSTFNYRNNNSLACDYIGSPSTNNTRPYMKLGMNLYGCVSQRVPAIVEVDTNTIPLCDAGLISIMGDTTSIESGILTPITVEIKNFATNQLTNATIHWSVNSVPQTDYSWIGSLAMGESQQVTIGSYTFPSGAITISATIDVSCDTIANNNTITKDLAACIGNSTATTEFTIGGTGSDYATIDEAIEELVVSGICGPVVYNIQPGEYTDRIIIPAIDGTDETNTITFKGQGDGVILTHANTTDEVTTNVLTLDSANNIYFKNLTIKGDTSSIYSSLVTIENAQNIHFENVVFNAPKKTNPTIDIVDIQGVNTGLYFVNDTFYNGARAITTEDLLDANVISSNIIIDTCYFYDFDKNAVNIYSFNDANFRRNVLRAHANTVASEAVMFNKVAGQSSINSNNIILTNGVKKNRHGISVHNSNFPDITPLYVANNSISILGTTSDSYGIDIDSSSFVQVYYNTVLQKSTSSNNKSRCLYVSSHSSSVMVRNNNLDNQMKSYAYYVEATDNQVTLSANNNYYGNGNRLTYWNTETATIVALQTANNMDQGSVNVINPFISDTVLRLLYPTDIVGAAEPLDDIFVDIDDSIRPINPNPTIGCYEYHFSDYDAGVIHISSPLPISYIEGTLIPITVTIRNFGNYSISNFQVVAQITGDKEGFDIKQTFTDTYTGVISSLDSAIYTFNNNIIAFLNDPYDDSLYIRVYTVLDEDTNNYNDTTFGAFLVIPGKDLSVTSVKKQAAAQCASDMRDVQIDCVIKNVGNVTITSSDYITISYEVRSKVTGGLLAAHTEQFTLPYTYTSSTGVTQTWNDLQPGSSMQYVTFATTVDMYSDIDTIWSVRASVRVIGDNRYDNDTSTAVEYKVLAAPKPPVGINDTINYGTYGTPMATHEDHLRIRWYADSTDANPVYAPSSYNPSTAYAIDELLYHDTTFYIRVETTGSAACPSYFDSSSVIVRPRCQSDLIAIDVVEPPHLPDTAYLYMSADSVKIRITNQGSTPQTGFTVCYGVKTTTTSAEDVITETCDMIINPDETITYAFKTLYDFTTYTNNVYRVRAWVSQGIDCEHSNDTTETIRIVPIKEMKTNTHSVANASSLDITRVQLGTMDNVSMAGDNTYSDYTTTVTPPVLFRGLTDSIFVLTQPAASMIIDENTILGGWMKIWIDWDRDGVFDDTDLAYQDTVYPGTFNRGAIQIPSTARAGYTKMRIIVAQNDIQHIFGPNPGSASSYAIAGGEIEDYKIRIMALEDVNAELSRFVSPEDLVYDTQKPITVLLRNTGANELTAADIVWTYNGVESIYNWTGSLASSESEEVVLYDQGLTEGLNTFSAHVDVAGDNYHANDTIAKRSFVFHTYMVPFSTNLDSVITIDSVVKLNDDFYAYDDNPKQPSNCWQMGTPAQTNKVITDAYSEPYVWMTNLSEDYPASNTSILYSPYFDISVIKPDTLSFRLRKEMKGDTKLTIEYTNYAGNWVTLGTMDDPHATNWYNDEEGFTRSNAAWEEVTYSLDAINGNLGSSLQFRFVFVSDDGAASDGVAIDNFSLGRAKRDLDAGVSHIELTPEKLPNYGQYFYPKVTVNNYGKKEITSFKVCYISEDMHIPQCEDVMLTIPIAGSVEYTFTHGRYLTSDMPDPFSIISYTRLNPEDLYTDNDTAYGTFAIGPLMNDVALKEIVEPHKVVASNDNVPVSIKIKNNGLTSVDTLMVGYSVGNTQSVTEQIIFNPGLITGDEYVYTFQTPYHSSFGTANIKVWVSKEGDNYHDNDTLYIRVEGTNASRDVEARNIVIDDSDPSNLTVQLNIFNRSSVGIDNIVVGYMVNGDPSTITQEIYRAGQVLTAGSMGYHVFSKKLPRAVYQSVCAYVIAEGDTTTYNDTTCTVNLGFRDYVADSLMIQQTEDPECIVQLRIHNAGTLGGRDTKIRANYIVNGVEHSQMFTIDYDEPNGQVVYLTFNDRIPRSDNSTYEGVAYLNHVENDVNIANDTTNIVLMKTYVGLDTVQDSDSDFILDQNVPNPFRDNTSISFTIPSAGDVSLIITNNNGQIVYNETRPFNEGKNTFLIDASSWQQGIYYYIVEFNGVRKSKKMIILQ